MVPVLGRGKRLCGAAGSNTITPIAFTDLLLTLTLLLCLIYGVDFLTTTGCCGLRRMRQMASCLADWTCI